MCGARMSAAFDSGPDRTPRLVELLLEEQRTLSAVDAFSTRHEAGDVSADGRVYEDRIPVGRTPGPGQQLAFRVDLDVCTGCKACVTACHSLNGLAPGETWREVGLLVGDGTGSVVQQIVTTACHHCEAPACLAGCPVQAYEKDPVTGIVRHLDDQCIGCQYCSLKCEYDVPKYNADLGIVRKCDMCAGRLEVGEAPACVQGCPNGAITIEIVDQVGETGRVDLLEGLEGSIPDSSHTRPTTRYVSSRFSQAMRPADSARLVPSKAHDPLAVGLVLLQLSVGIVLFDGIVSILRGGPLASGPLGPIFAVGFALLGLGAATAHLGRPLYAFRAILGWRTSWMSREILAFGFYLPVVLAAAALGVGWAVAHSGSGMPPPLRAMTPFLLSILKPAALVAGLLGTVSSIMIYVDTKRAAWSLSRTGWTFIGTTVGLGALGEVIALALGIRWSPGSSLLPIGLLAIVAIGVLGAKAAFEARFLFAADRGQDRVVARTARLLRGPLRRKMKLRLGFTAAGLTTLSFAVVVLLLRGADAVFVVLALGSLVSCVSGELLERHLYFVSEAGPGMPGQ